MRVYVGMRGRESAEKMIPTFMSAWRKQLPEFGRQIEMATAEALAGEAVA